MVLLSFCVVAPREETKLFRMSLKNISVHLFTSSSQSPNPVWMWDRSSNQSVTYGLYGYRFIYSQLTLGETGQIGLVFSECYSDVHMKR